MEGGRGLTSTKDSIDVTIQELEKYIKMSKNSLIAASSHSTDNIRTNRKTIKARKQKCEKNDKLAILHTKRPGHGSEGEISR